MNGNDLINYKKINKYKTDMKESGAFKLANVCSSSYIAFAIDDREITIYVINFKSKCLFVKVNPESESIIKWSHTLQQSPENYISHLSQALRDQALDQDGEDSNEIIEQEKAEGQNACNKNIFELEANNNILVWKQFFKKKNLFGRKGKFALEETSREETLETAFDGLINELKRRRISILKLDEDTRKLIKEKEELGSIAEESVSMKENFEKMVYRKFATLLNTKKKKNLELLEQLKNVKKQEEPSSVSSFQSPSSSSSKAQPASSSSVLIKQKKLSGDEYDSDTDVDSPDDCDPIENEAAGIEALSLKRHGNKMSSENSEIQTKKIKCSSIVLPDSQDFLNDSMDTDLQFGLSSRCRKRK